MANRELTTIRGEVLSWRAPGEGRPGAFRIDWNNSTIELTVWPDRATGDIPNSIESMNPDSLVGATVQVAASYKGEYIDKRSGLGIDQYLPVGSKPIRLVSQATPESNSRVARKLASQPDGMAIGNANNVAVELVKFLWTALERKPSDDDIKDGVRMILLASNGIAYRTETEPDTTPSVEEVAEEVAEAGDDDPIFVV